MATAGEEETSYGGAGGKFRKRPFRRPQTTPYDRPPTVIRNPRGEGWLSKLVDPASKFISARAFKFFSNFRKRLTEAEHEPRDEHQEAVPNNCNGTREPEIDRNGSLTTSSDGSGILELEQMLKQKTFTRSEIDRLTQLLRSRTVDFPVGDEEKMNEGNLLKAVSDLERHHARSPLQENRNDGNKFQSVSSTPGVSSRVLEEDIASPAELAKAYMGSRPSKVSASMLGLRSQALKEEAPSLLNHVLFPSKSSALSSTSKSLLRVWVPENGFTTPRSRGRSAIYSMARTPYSRGTGSTNYAYGAPSSSSQSALEHNGQFGSKQLTLKRRNSVLDDDTRSVGAVRRIRHKPNLSYHISPLSTRGAGVGYGVGYSSSQHHIPGVGYGVGYSSSQHHIPLTQKPFLLDAKNKVSKDMEEIGDDSIRSSSYSVVPSESSEMATKILQHLEKFTPKEKSSESKLVAARDRSPFKLTPNMLHGQALRSLEDVDSTKFLQKQDDPKFQDSSNAWLQDVRDLTSQKQSKVEENGPKESEVNLKLSTSSVSGDVTISMNNVPKVKNADSVISNAAQPPQKRRAFRMSAHEDFLELDDEIHTNGLVSAPLAEGKVVSTEALAVEKTPANPDVKIHEGNTTDRKDLDNSGGLVTAKENTGLNIPASLAPSSTSQQNMPIQSISVVDKFVSPRDPNPCPLSFGLSSKNVDKVPSFSFSSTSTSNESPGFNPGSWPDPRQENSNSLVNETQLKFLESDKGDDTNTQKAENASESSDISPAAMPTSTSTSGFFSSIASAKINNGFPASSSSRSSTIPTLASSNFMKQISVNGSTSVSSFTEASTMTSAGTKTITATLDGGPSSSSAPPSIPAAPTGASINGSTSVSSFTNASAMTSAGTKTITATMDSGPSSSSAPPSIPAEHTGASIFSFGSSSIPPSSAATFSTATAAEISEINSKTEKETTFGNLSKPSFGGTSFAMASTGSNPFGFSSSLTSSAGSNQSQGSLFGSGSLLVVNTQAPPATGASAVTQSIPFQFGSSGSSPVFGASANSSFTTTSSVIGSSVPAAKPFISGMTFALCSSSSSSDANTIGFTSAATSSIFNSSWQTSKSPVIGSVASSSSPSTGFSFGASSTSIVATNSAPMVFGLSTGTSSSSMFSSTSATATTSSLPSLSQSQPVFGNIAAFRAQGNSGDQMTMEDSMAEDPVHSSPPTVPVFGQPLVSPSASGFMFGSTAPLPSPSPSTFLFGGQQNPATSQNPSPFLASSSLDFSAGGSFSLGSGGGDKSARKMVRVSRSRNRKK